MAGRKLVIYVLLLSPVPAAGSDIIIKNNILVLFCVCSLLRYLRFTLKICNLK